MSNWQDAEVFHILRQMCNPLFPWSTDFPKRLTVDNNMVIA